MKQANIINLLAYREHDKIDPLLPEGIYTEDLVTAIQSLIRRLRECDPIKQPDDAVGY